MQALREILPGLPVVYMTGSRVVTLKGIDGAPLLLKPFSGEDLMRAIGEVLAAPAE